MKRIVGICLLLALLCSTTVVLSGCGSTASGEAVKMGFGDRNVQQLKGKQVTIIGYMATLSPINGQYIYLMNLPYQSCPFCIPNSTVLANTVAVYAPAGKPFSFTDQAIQVTGTLEVGHYTDEFGYEYGYRIVNATYTIVDLSALPESYKLWYSLASDGIVADIYSMFDYVHFCCQWPIYESSYTDENGAEIRFWLYPGDVNHYLALEGINGYAHQSSADYFPGLIRRVESVSATELTDLIEVVKEAAAVEKFARAELDNGNYTYDEAADQFTLTNNDELLARYNAAYRSFAEWLTRWEL